MIIYKTTNLINGKIYIGQTNGKRKSYKGGGKILKLAFKKYGRNNFKTEVIVDGEFNMELTNELEKHYIRLYNSTNKCIGYNLESGGTGGGGRPVSKETRTKMSRSNVNRAKQVWSDERRKAMSIAKTGLKYPAKTKESIARFRLKMCGRLFTEDHKKSLKVSHCKYIYGVYKKNILHKEHICLKDCAISLGISPNTLNVLFDTGKEYKGFTFTKERNHVE